MSQNRTSDERATQDNSDYTLAVSKSMIVRWTFLAILIAGVILFLPVAYLHARWRVHKGRPPLQYHRWLLCSSRERRRSTPLHRQSNTEPNQPTVRNLTGLYNPADGIDLFNAESIRMVEVAPPAYDPNGLRPPSYRSPAPSFKTEPSVRGEPWGSTYSLVVVSEQFELEQFAEIENTASAESLTAGR